MSYLLEDIDSTLIKEIEYNPDTRDLRIVFRKYYVEQLVYQNVPFNYFEELSCPTGKSVGRFYLEMIKPNFKLKINNMGKEKPKTVNTSGSDQKRFIRCSIDVTAINKDWLVPAESGKVYLNFTLQHLKTGELDRFGNLGMITQDVPSEVYEKEKHLPVEKRTRGEILGNGCEFERKPKEGAPGDTAAPTLENMDEEKKQELIDDLPF